MPIILFNTKLFEMWLSRVELKFNLFVRNWLMIKQSENFFFPNKYEFCCMKSIHLINGASRTWVDMKFVLHRY